MLGLTPKQSSNPLNWNMKHYKSAEFCQFSEAIAWMCAPLQNPSIEQWRMVVIGTGYTSFVTSQYDVMSTFADQRLGEVCWHTMNIILHALSLLVVVQYVTVMSINQRSKLGGRSKNTTQR